MRTLGCYYKKVDRTLYDCGHCCAKNNGLKHPYGINGRCANLAIALQGGRRLCFLKNHSTEELGQREGIFRLRWKKQNQLPERPGMADLWRLRMEARFSKALSRYLAAYIVSSYARMACRVWQSRRRMLGKLEPGQPPRHTKRAKRGC